MPGLEDWIEGPLNVIETLFEKNSETKQHIHEVEEYFKKKLSDSLYKIPSINDVPLHNLKNNTLVKFRCMIQDMYDPEFYMGVFQVKDVKCGKTFLRSGMWKDLEDSRSHEEIDLNSNQSKVMDRQILYCVPIPGENNWAKEEYRLKNHIVEAGSSSVNSRRKRSLDNDDGHIAGNDNRDDIETNTGAGRHSENKKAKLDETKLHTDSKDCAYNLNFPLVCEENGPACLVKIYDSEDSFKVNDMVEFIGVLSKDPAMTDFPKETKPSDATKLVNAAEMMMDTEEHKAHSPPPSIVPRLHVITSQKLHHSNPYLSAALNENDCQTAEIQEILSSASYIRGKLVHLLKEALYGDELAAEYILCHIISNVYARRDVAALGKFSINLRGCPKDVPFPTHLYSVLKCLIPKSHFIPLTVAGLNNYKLTPNKDFSANRLISGQLQLSANTELVVDETVMMPGQLDVNGVNNLAAIGNVTLWQKVEYDFNYYKQDFPCNMSVLVMSEGKSLLTCDSQLTLVPQLPIENSSIAEHFENMQQCWTPKMLKLLRSYITLVQLMPYSVPENIQQEIENEFVERRKDKSDEFSVEDFQTLLILARLVSKSFGRTVLDAEMWLRSKNMEQQRKCRIQNS